MKDSGTTASKRTPAIVAEMRSSTGISLVRTRTMSTAADLIVIRKGTRCTRDLAMVQMGTDRVPNPATTAIMETTLTTTGTLWQVSGMLSDPGAAGTSELVRQATPAIARAGWADTTAAALGRQAAGMSTTEGIVAPVTTMVGGIFGSAITAALGRQRVIGMGMPADAASQGLTNGMVKPIAPGSRGRSTADLMGTALQLGVPLHNHSLISSFFFVPLPQPHSLISSLFFVSFRSVFFLLL